MPSPRAAAPCLAVLLLGLLAAALIPAGAHAREVPDACAGADAAPSSASGRELGPAVLCLLNRERGGRGLAPLRPDARLRRAAARHSTHMTRARFFSHTSPAGASVADRARRAGYGAASRRWSIGENIGWGAGSQATPREIVRSWMRSAPHRAIVLDGRYRDIGVGIALGAPLGHGAPAGGATYTTDFGRRR